MSAKIRRSNGQDLPMIIIEITNVEDLVKQKLGGSGFGAKLVNLAGSNEARVEKIVIDALKERLGAQGIKANLFSLADVDMLGNGRIEIPVKVRSADFMS
ncbi:MAG: cytochrome-c oxidase [Cyanobacteria bacterium P01_H01_bin.121]